MEKLRNIWTLTVDELVNKVTWPTWEELRQSAIIVIIASLIFAVVVYGIDLGVGKLFQAFYSFFK